VVASLVFVAGCGEKKAGKVADSKGTKAGKRDDHEHAHGPHDGDLIELGNEEYHAEMVHDEDTHKVTFHILDSAAKKSVPISAKEVVVNYTAGGKPQQFSIPAAPLPGEPEGQSSRFEVVSEELCESICHDTKAKARLAVTVDDKQYNGAIEAHDH
jgi:hypothetical protein